MKIKRREMKTFATALAALAALILIGAACSWLPGGDKKFVATAPPDGLFPQQMGEFTLTSEPKQSEFVPEDAKYKTYYVYYKSKAGNNIECSVSIYDELLSAEPSNNPASSRMEEVYKNDSILVTHDVPIERMNALVRGERILYSARTDSVPAIQAFVESLPYGVIKTAAPPKLNLVVTPAEFDKKPTDKSDAELDKTVRETLMSGIEIWCKGKGLTCSPHPSKTDRSTLIIDAKGKTGSDVDKRADALAKELKQIVGKSLKDFGFRQLALDLSVEKF